MTIRTKTEIEQIYLTTSGRWPDNTTGQISPLDLRDGVQDVLDTVYNDLSVIPNGAVFITDVAPTVSGSVGNKSYTDSIVLNSCQTDTELLTVSVLAITGSSSYKPDISIQGINVTNLSLSDSHEWTGTAAIDLDGSGTITAVHGDGPTHTTSVTFQAGPEITQLEFTGGYPGTQTELKENDTFNITVTTDQPTNRIAIDNFEAGKSTEVAVTLGTGPHIVPVTIADRGTGTFSTQRARVRARNASGAWGGYRLTDVDGSGDGSATVELNSDVPEITISGIDYPATQQAIKISEGATVNHTCTLSSESTFSYDSPNSQISISNNTTYETAKSISYVTGGYNVSTNNFRLTVTKTSNGASDTAQTVVNIANDSPTITITEPFARLRSGESPQNYTITLSSNQQLIEAPTLSGLGTDEGVWVGGFTGGPSNWTRTLQVVDSDNKGTFTYTGLVAINLADKEVNVISGNDSYVLGGFTFRTLTVSAWPNREVSIGTNVSDTSKLECTNLSKGLSGSLNFSYQGSTSNNVDSFTITDGSQNFDADGTHWYNCDLANAVSNTGGTMQIELEETV